MKHQLRKSVWVIIFLIIFNNFIHAQNTAKSNEEVITNNSVIVMVQAGLSPSIIINKIRSSKTSFSVTTDELLRLKKEKVPDEIVSAMMQADQIDTAKTAQPVTEPIKLDPADPRSPHEPGIYVMLENEGQSSQLIQIEPSIYSQAKSGGMFKSAMTYGIAKVKSRAVLAGEHANRQLENRRPVFYFYFEVTNAGLSNSGNIYNSSSTSPNEFILAKMDVKKSTRELVVGQFSAFGAQSGASDEYIHQLSYEKIAPGIFKVTPRGELPPGEYCFFYGGATPLATYGFFGAGGGSKVFDFGVVVAR